MKFDDFAEAALPYMALALITAAVLTAFMTPYVRDLAHRMGVVDRPDHRRVNRNPVPRGGGLAVVAAFVPVVIVVTSLNDVLGSVPTPDTIGPPEMTALLVGGIAAAVIGALDDYFQLRARWQLAGQLALGVGVVALGITVDFINNPVGPGLIRFGGLIGGAFTVFWIVGMINSINWIDGLDGLSSGIGMIAALTLGIISLTIPVGQPYVAVLCFALAGALLGFLRWNFHPATIFVGTSGTMFIGYTLALLAILGTAKVAVAMLVLSVPIIDTFWNIVRRLAARRSPFTPDRGHLHHRLLDVGLSHTQTVLLIYCLCVALAVLTFVLSGAAQIYAFVIYVLGSGLALYLLSRWTLRSGGPDDSLPVDGPRTPDWSPPGTPPAPDPAPTSPPNTAEQTVSKAPGATSPSVTARPQTVGPGALVAVVPRAPAASHVAASRPAMAAGPSAASSRPSIGRTNGLAADSAAAAPRLGASPALPATPQASSRAAPARDVRRDDG